jgi:hydrogenase nickel incorporation protein HypB
MCAVCGCSDDVHGVGHVHHDHDAGSDHGDGHGHHGHGHHGHDHHAERRPRSIVAIEQDILAKNDRLAGDNRRWLRQRGVFAVNLVSSPGAGKTTLLERTIRELGDGVPIAVIEGDQATDRDARRIRAAGARAIQINTGAGCHLDAAMVSRALGELDPPRGSVLAIENVGNLVCPALFDLGERFKVVVSSVTEGDDKPLKYPVMFRASDVAVLNKVDLLPHVDFDVDAFVERVRGINARAQVFVLSATRGDGMSAFYSWLRDQTAGGPAA